MAFSAIPVRIAASTLVCAAAATLLTGCGDDELSARPVPRNLCSVVGTAILNRLAPGAYADVKIGEISDDMKRLTCVAQITRDQEKKTSDPVLFAVELTRYGSGDAGLPSDEADAVLTRLQEKRPDGDGIKLENIREIDDVTGAKFKDHGYLWTDSKSGEGVPELELVVQRDDSVFRITYEPVPGVEMATARRWLVKAGSDIVNRFDNIHYGHDKS